eukprot:8290519-Pyramimonas_sp.AAC.2
MDCSVVAAFEAIGLSVATGPHHFARLGICSSSSMSELCAHPSVFLLKQQCESGFPDAVAFVDHLARCCNDLIPFGLLHPVVGLKIVREVDKCAGKFKEWAFWAPYADNKCIM